MAMKVQRQEGYDGPIPGRILAASILPTGSTIHSQWRLKLECEIAFRLNQDITPTHNKDWQTELAQPLVAFDITASRYDQQWLNSLPNQQRMLAQLADNGNGGFIVIGPSLCGNSITIRLNDKPVFVQQLSDDPSPYHALSWVSNHSRSCDIALRKGDFILTGALNPPIALTSGDRVTAKMGDDKQESPPQLAIGLH